MSDIYDAVIIGAGHNGLVAGAYLARAGLKVLILERREVLGGAAATEEVIPGYHFNTGADEAALFLPEIVGDLRLRRWGLQFLESPAAFTALNPAGRALVIWRDQESTIAELDHHSVYDRDKFMDFVRTVTKYASLVNKMMVLTPPDLGKSLRSIEAQPWLNPAIQLRRLGGDDMMAFLRLLPISAAEFLAEYFEGDLLRGALSTFAVRGAFQGPMAAGTGLQFLYHTLSTGLLGGADRRFVQGGLGGLSAALHSAAEAHQAEIQTGEEIQNILIRDGKAVGVSLESGDEISSRIVISSADPRSTFFELVGAHELPLNVVRRVKNIRFRGSTAKVNFAISGLPDFQGITGLDGLKGRIIVSPAVEYLERAYDNAKYGEFSSKPALEFVIPSLLDPSLAPPGNHVISVSVRYTPYHLREGIWDDRREELGDLVTRTLAEVAPDLPERVVDRQILTPLDLEREYNLTEGSIYHGQMGLDQMLFMRPIPGYSRYRTPIVGLYLCGAGTHPGGGVSGAPGYNAAREIYSDWMEL